MQASHGGSISCILDTYVVVDFLRRKDYVRELLLNWAGKGLLATSSITHLEVYAVMRSGEETATNAFLDGLTSIAVDVTIARVAGDMLKDLRSKGVTVGIADSVIAATAVQLDVPLLTNNVNHYPFKGLKVVRGLEI